MRLLELTEPLFQYVCRLNRSARKGVGLEPNLVRSDIKSLLAEMHEKGASEPGMSEQLRRVELPLIYFVDFMIKESDLSFAREWRELAHEQNKLAGDEEFFDLLDETLKDPTEAATERLEVFYTCLGLGFTGFYTGQPEYLRKKMMEVSARLRGRMDTDRSSRVCPESYEHVDTSDLVQPPGRSLAGFGVALAALAIVLLIGNAYLYRSFSGEMTESLRAISETGERAAGQRGEG